MIVINREKAENLTWERLRKERDGRLVELDLLFIKALETGGDTSQVVVDKQSLRDVTLKDISSLSLQQLATLSLDQALSLP